MKLFAGRPGEFSMIALRPQEMPDHRDWIAQSLARTESTYSQIVDDDMPQGYSFP